VFFEVHTKPIVSTGWRFQFRHFVGIDSSCSLVVWNSATLAGFQICPFADG
jgi:hypothetical protein